ncbi:MAG: hypothetical protein WCT12_28590, partial [Verrucomicrobiota bacterium]
TAHKILKVIDEARTGATPLKVSISGGTLDIKITVATQAARLALTITDVQNGDYVFQTDTSILYEVTDQSALGTAAAFTALATVTWDQVTGKPASATQAEAEAGTETALRMFSPARVKQAISALGIPEAPSDSKQYARKNAAWTEVAAGGAWITLSATPITAVAGNQYVLRPAGTGTTVNDPVTAVAGDFYVVLVAGDASSVIVGGVTYHAGDLIRRVYTDSSWVSYLLPASTSAGRALLTAADAAAQRAAIGVASVRLIKTTDFTSDINGRYTVNGTATVTDASGTVAGQIYSVVIGSGTATIGGVAYAPSRVEVIRYYNGSAWTTLSPTFSDNLTLNGTGNLAPNQTSASASSLMTRSLCDTRYQSTAPLFRKFNADIIYPIGLYAVTGGILTNGGNTIFNSGMRQIQATSTANSTALLIFPGIITNTSGNTDFSYGWTGFSVIMSLPYREGCTTRVGIGGVLTADTVMPVGSMNCRGMAIEFQMSSSVLQWRMITENDSGTENITSWAGIGALALFYEIAVFVNNATAYALVRPITADVSTVPTWTVNASLSGCTAGIVAGMVGCMVGVVNNGGAAGSCSAQIHALTFFHTQNDPR